MTWVRLGAQYPDELAIRRISDGAFRLHTEALCWLCHVEAMDCRVPKHLVRRFAGGADPDLAAKELVESGFWRDGGDCWLIEHHGDVIRQGLGAQRAKRERDRTAQQAARNRAAARAAKAESDEPVSHDVSADASADISDGISHDVNATLTTYLPHELSSAEGVTRGEHTAQFGVPRPGEDQNTCERTFPGQHLWEAESAEWAS